VKYHKFTHYLENIMASCEPIVIQQVKTKFTTNTNNM